MSASSSMPMDDLSIVVILVSVGLALLVLLVFMAMEVLRRLSRLEKRVSNLSQEGETRSFTISKAESMPGGAFETFLEEDPARRAMPKAERFAAYRKWRQENGLNWPKVQ